METVTAEDFHALVGCNPPPGEFPRAASVARREPRELPPSDALVTATQLGDFLGISSARIHELARNGELPRTDNHRFPFRESVRAYCDQLRRHAIQKRDSTEIEAQKVRLATEQADKIALQNARARGDLIPAAEVATEWRSIVADLRARILAVPSRVASRIGLDRAALGELDAEVREALSEIADDG